MASNEFGADDVVNFDILDMPEDVLMAFLEPFDNENIDPNSDLPHINEKSPSVIETKKVLSEQGTPRSEIKQETRAEQSVNVDGFIQGQKKLNTVRSTERDIRNVQRWLWDNKKEPRLIEKIAPSALNDFLSELYITIRKTDGSDYEPSSLETLKNSIERHLKDEGYAVSLRDRIFHKSNQALTAKKMQLKKTRPRQKVKCIPCIKCR